MVKDTELHISHSQLSTFLLCPMKYAHQYVWGTKPESKPAALILGSAIHKAAETYYRSIQEIGNPMPLDVLVSFFESALNKEARESDVGLSFKKGESLKDLREQGIELVKVFHAETTPQRILDVEYPFSLPVPDLNSDGYLPIKLVGYFDLIEADDEGGYVVGELKTAAQRFSRQRLDYDLQATIYSYAMSQLGLATSPESCLVRYDVLLKTKKPALEKYFVVRSTADYARLIHLINQVLRVIEARIFYRQTGWQCDDCQFKKACLEA